MRTSKKRSAASTAALFDRTSSRWSRVAAWHDRKEEFVKRAAFALLWGLTVHDKLANDAAFIDGLRLIEQGTTDTDTSSRKR